MDCNHVKRLLPVYIDNELSAVESLDVDQHLHDCSSCKREYTRHLALHHAVTHRATYHQAPAQLLTNVRETLDMNRTAAPTASTKPSAKYWNWLPLGAAFASLLTIGIGLKLYFQPANEVTQLSQEMVAGYARSMITNHTTDVASSDRHTVKPWFNGKLNYAPMVLDLTGQGFPLVGGRLDYIAEQPVAVMVYRHRQHLINLFCWPATRTNLTPISPTTQQGYHLIFWTHAGMSYGLISDLNLADLTRLKVTILNQLEE